MSRVIYAPNSPYSSTPQTTWFLSNMNWRKLPPDSSDVLYTLQSRHQYRPDTLSYDLYQTPAYYWIFCIRNPFLRADPIWLFTTGTTIWVPTLDYLRRVIG